jgi:aerobic carbon-monoxide dehydrogenase large subunit
MKQVRRAGEGVGSSLLRLEDERYLRGRGCYIADIRLPGMLDVAFVRSPLAHARVRGIGKPAARESSVFIAADLDGVKGIRADSGLPGFRSSVQPILASDKVRHVGEPLAACVAESRAEAEDLAELVSLDLDELPAVVEMIRARDPGAPLVHEHWPENVFLETAVDVNFAAAAKDAAVVVKRTFRTARQQA